MKTNSLRSEFVIAGAGFLLTAFWFWELIRSLTNREEIPGLRSLMAQNSSSGPWIFATAVAVGGSYVVGALIIQITFEYPTRKMILQLRRNRLDELRKLDGDLDSSSSTVADSDPRAKLLKHLFNGGAASPSDQKLMLTLGRAQMSDELRAEYVYRRSNRQIFIGMMPTAYVFAIDCGLWTMFLPISTSRYVIGGAVGAVLVTTVICLYRPKIPFNLNILFRAAAYQEEIAQGLIVDSAFLARWHEST